jgi:hypothetical protein
MVDINDIKGLRFYTLGETDLQETEKSEGQACQVTLKVDDFKLAPSGSTIGIVTCNFPKHEPVTTGEETFRHDGLPAKADQFLLVKEQDEPQLDPTTRLPDPNDPKVEHLWIFHQDQKLKEIEFPQKTPEQNSHVLLRRNPRTTNPDPQIAKDQKPFGDDQCQIQRVKGDEIEREFADCITFYKDPSQVHEAIKALKEYARTIIRDIANGPIFTLKLGGMAALGATEFGIPSSTVGPHGLTLTKDANGGFSGNAFDLALHLAIPEGDGFWYNTLNTLARLDARWATGGMSAGEGVSGQPGSDATIDYSQLALELAPRIRAQQFISSGGRGAQDANWDLYVGGNIPLISRTNLSGTVPFGGRSIAERLDMTHVGHPFKGSPFADLDPAIVIGGTGCFELGSGGRSKTCLGLSVNYRFARELTGDQAAYRMNPPITIALDFSTVNYAHDETFVRPFTVHVADATPPTIQPYSQDEIPALAEISIPRQIKIELSGDQVYFAQGSSSLTARMDKTRRALLQKELNAPVRNMKDVLALTVLKELRRQYRRLQHAGHSQDRKIYILIGGHASPEGNDERNMRISLRRAAEVKSFVSRTMKQTNDRAWKKITAILRKGGDYSRAELAEKRAEWKDKPYPDAAQVEYRIRGYGETEPVDAQGNTVTLTEAESDAANARGFAKKGAAPTGFSADLPRSRRVTVSAYTDFALANEVMKPEMISHVVAETDEEIARKAVEALVKEGIVAEFHSVPTDDPTAAADSVEAEDRRMTIFLGVNVEWKNPARVRGDQKIKLSREGKAYLLHLRGAIAKLYKSHFSLLSRNVAVQVGMVSSPPSDDSNTKADRLDVAMNLLFDFEQWQFKGPSNLIAIPEGNEPIAYMKQLEVPTLTREEREKIAADLKVTKAQIGDQWVKVFKLPVDMYDDQKPTIEFLHMMELIGSTHMEEGEWAQVILYENDFDDFNETRFLKPVGRRLVDAYMSEKRLERLEEPHRFILRAMKKPHPTKATAVYVVVSSGDKEINKKAVEEAIYKMAYDENRETGSE